MEQTKVRYKVILTKAQVTQVQDGELGTRVLVRFPQGMTLDMDLSFRPDARVGDIITIYTELFAHANTGSTSVN